MTHPYQRPDRKALDELEPLLREVVEQLAGWRRRSLRAEAELKEIRTYGGPHATPELAEARRRVLELEGENQVLRQRIEAARERLRVLAARLSFLEQTGGNAA